LNFKGVEVTEFFHEGTRIAVEQKFVPLTPFPESFIGKNGLSDRRIRGELSPVDPGVAPANSARYGAIKLPPQPHDKYARFLPVAGAIATMSKQPTKVGCVILGSEHETLSTGWNGVPRGSGAEYDARHNSRESRLTWVVHAEANAIANAARSGTSLRGGTLVCTLMPCMTCAKLIVQAGIVRVICLRPGDDMARWHTEFDTAATLFAECGVALHQIEEQA
jgi:dCMP deaminase